MAKPSAPSVGSTARNRLAAEPSPYLQQHATNPVDWWPWGEAAFAEARRRDAPIFLSIGYATCHWCHVMAHESFEDPEVARLMNEAFVNVKVDREERPDVDDAYMAVCQAMTGSGGWPLTVFLSPDKKPFLAGTYFPKTTRFGRMGMVDLVPKISEAWTMQRAELLQQAEHVLDHVGTSSAVAGELPSDAFEKAEAQLAQRFDRHHGGFGRAPKFPSPHTLLFLLRRHARTKDPATLEMVVRTLDGMAAGGIRDHLGGGFHRYSTDVHWLLPHFEKMLYDQAMLAMTYTEAFQATGEPRFSAVARETLDYVLRDLKDPAGGLRCAEDADSEGVEGKFYVWSRAEVQQALGQDADLFCLAYGVSTEGNFNDEATHQRTGANVLHLPRPLVEVAKARGMTAAELETRLAAGRKALLAERAKRVRPQLDDKVLTDWNGLAIAALAKAGTALGEPRYTQAAVDAALFLKQEMVRKHGRLRHRFRARGHSHAAAKDEMAFLDDHAFLLWGLLELHDATLDAAWLAWAVQVADALRHFRDPSDGGGGRGGGWFLSPDDGEDLGVRRKEAYDGALPSGNAVAAWSLVRLALLTGDTRWEEDAVSAVGAFAGLAGEHPQAFTGLLLAHDLAAGPSRELLVAGSGKPALDLIAEARRRFDPHRVLLHQSAELAKVAPWTSGHKVGAGEAAAFLCEGHACKRPVTTARDLQGLLA
ncbi:MAG: thioredoxin domain-containing protein [Thermoplasmatota archaeon]